MPLAHLKRPKKNVKTFFLIFNTNNNMLINLLILVQKYGPHKFLCQSLPLKNVFTDGSHNNIAFFIKKQQILTCLK